MFGMQQAAYISLMDQLGVLPTTPLGWVTTVVAGVAVLLMLLLQNDRAPVAGGDTNRSPQPAAAAAAATATAAATDDSGEPPTCRICYAGAEAGRLFSPCLCSGTMAFVHVHCLNEWRAQSVNPKSVFQCDQCGYQYRTERTRAAAALQSELCIWLASTLLVASTVALAAALPGEPERRLYEMAAWRPHAEIEGWNSWCDRLVAGMMLPAGLGFLYEIYDRFRRAQDRVNGAFSMLCMVSFVHNQIGPALLGCCALYFWTKLARELHTVARALLVRFGEAVLEVRR